MRLRIDTHGNEKQKRAVRAWVDPEKTDIVYGGAKGGGKSFLGVSLIFGNAFMYPGTYYFIARTALNDIRKFTIPSIHEVIDEIWGLTGRYRYNGQDNFFELDNRSRVYLLQAKPIPSDPLYARFGSMQMTQGWIEEAGGFDENAKNNLQASVGRWKNDRYHNLPGKLLQTCNPSKNYLYRDYYEKWRKQKLEAHKDFIQAFPQDNKMLPKGYIENLRRSLSPNEILRLLEGLWEFDDDPDALVSWQEIGDIFTNTHVQEKGQPYLIADLAMAGRDDFVTAKKRGGVIEFLQSKNKVNAKQIEEDLRRLKEAHGVPNRNIIADSDGLGSYLSAYLENIWEFHGGTRPKDKKYGNIKDECGFKLAEEIKDSRIRIICTPEEQDEIKRELSVCLRRIINLDDNKLRLMKKSEMKEKLGRSPDYLDVLIMAMLPLVKPQFQAVL